MDTPLLIFWSNLVYSIFMTFSILIYYYAFDFTTYHIFKVRFNDMFTDAFRSLYLESKGYEVSPLEYVSPLDTPKNIMIRAVKKRDENPIAKAEYQQIKKMFGIDPLIDKL